MSISPGDIAFFKQFKHDTKQKTPTHSLRGYGFGVFLGYTPPFGKEPTEVELMGLMGTAGFISFDDLGRLMGQEILTALLYKMGVARIQQQTIDEMGGLNSEQKACAAKGDPVILTEEQKTAITARIAEEQKKAEQSTAKPPERPRLVGLNGAPLEKENNEPVI